MFVVDLVRVQLNLSYSIGKTDTLEDQSLTPSTDYSSTLHTTQNSIPGFQADTHTSTPYLTLINQALLSPLLHKSRITHKSNQVVGIISNVCISPASPCSLKCETINRSTQSSTAGAHACNAFHDATTSTAAIPSSNLRRRCLQSRTSRSWNTREFTRRRLLKHAHRSWPTG